jgi:class 3 adenylate cyclase/esterase/lipase
VSVGETEVAYQVIGDGPRDLLWCFGLVNNIESHHDTPALRNADSRMASFSRLIRFDRRGAGVSGPIATGDIATWEEWTNDIEAVLDAVGSERATILGLFDAGPIAKLFAATRPERVEGLVLLESWARFQVADDFPIGVPSETISFLVEVIRTGWGTPDFVRLVAPKASLDSATLESLARQLRQSATPRSAAAQFDYMYRNVDVRPALSLIQAPTVIIQGRNNPLLNVAHGRFLADHIRDAKLVELPGDWGGLLEDEPAYLDEVEEFMTGARRPTHVDRVLTTVLFSDIVGSTERAAEIGDRRWRIILDEHDQLVRQELQRHGGREIKTTGDGFMASFDGPARAIHCARAITSSVTELGLKVRTGLHTGECEIRGDDLGGLAVHIAARVGAAAGPEEVLVSGTVKDLVVGSGIEFEGRGEHSLKGVPGIWKLFAVKT